MLKQISYSSIDQLAFLSLHLADFKKPSNSSLKILNNYFYQLVSLNDNVPIYLSTIDSEQLIVHKQLAFAEILHVLLYWFDFINQFENRIIKTTELHWSEFMAKYYPKDQERLSTLLAEIKFYDFVRKLVSNGLQSIAEAKAFSFPSLASLKEDSCIDKNSLFHEHYKIFEKFYNVLQLPQFSKVIQSDLTRQIEQIQLFETFYLKLKFEIYADINSSVQVRSITPYSSISRSGLQFRQKLFLSRKEDEQTCNFMLEKAYPNLFEDDFDEFLFSEADLEKYQNTLMDLGFFNQSMTKEDAREMHESYSEDYCCLLIHNLEPSIHDLNRFFDTFKFDQLVPTIRFISEDSWDIHIMTMVDVLALFCKSYLKQSSELPKEIRSRLINYFKKQKYGPSTITSHVLSSSRFDEKQFFYSLNTLYNLKLIQPNKLISWLLQSFDFLKSFLPSDGIFNLDDQIELLNHCELFKDLDDKFKDEFYESFDHTFIGLIEFFKSKELYQDQDFDPDKMFNDSALAYNEFLKAELPNLMIGIEPLSDLFNFDNFKGIQITKFEKETFLSQFKAALYYILASPITLTLHDSQADWDNYRKQFIQAMKMVIECVSRIPIQSHEPTDNLISYVSDSWYELSIKLIEICTEDLNRAVIDQKNIVRVLNILFNHIEKFLMLKCNEKIESQHFNGTELMESISEVATAVSIGYFQLFFAEGDFELAKDYFNQYIISWSQLQVNHYSIKNPFWQQLFDEYKINLSLNETTHFQTLDVLMIRLISDASVKFLESLSLAMNQFLSKEKQIKLLDNRYNHYELKADFYGLRSLHENMFNPGFTINNRLPLINFRRPLKDEWYFREQLNLILASDSSIFTKGTSDNFNNRLPIPNFYAQLTITLKLGGERLSYLVSFLKVINEQHFNVMKVLHNNFSSVGLSQAVDDYIQLIAKASQKVVNEFITNHRNEYIHDFKYINQFHKFVDDSKLFSSKKPILEFMSSFKLISILPKDQQLFLINYLEQATVNHISNKFTHSDFLNAVIQVLNQILKNICTSFKDGKDNTDHCLPYMVRLSLFPLIMIIMKKDFFLFDPTITIPTESFIKFYFDHTNFDPLLPDIDIPLAYRRELYQSLILAKEDKDWKIVSEKIDKVLATSIFDDIRLAGKKDTFELDLEDDKFFDQSQLRKKPSSNRSNKKKKKKKNGGSIKTLSKDYCESVKMDTLNISENNRVNKEDIDLVAEKVEHLSMNNNHSIIDMVSTYISDYLEAGDFEVSKSSQSTQPIWRDAFDDLLEKIALNNFNVPEFPKDLEKDVLRIYLNDQVLPYFRMNQKVDSLPLFISRYNEKDQSFEKDSAELIKKDSTLDFEDYQADSQNVLANGALADNDVDLNIKFRQFSDTPNEHKVDHHELENDNLKSSVDEPAIVKVDQVVATSVLDKSSKRLMAHSNKEIDSLNLYKNLTQSYRVLSDREKLSRIDSTSQLFVDFLQLHQLFPDVYQFLNNCSQTMKDSFQPLNIRYLNCEWLYGAINSLEKLMLNDGQEYHNLNNHYDENLKYLRENCASYDGLFNDQVAILRNIDQYILYLETLPNYSSLHFKAILNKSIFMLRNSIEYNC